MEKMKRIELHLHTKLSDDISVIEPKEALEYAIANSYKAIAFTNLNNVLDFPYVAAEYAQLSNSGTKVIYGAELRYIGGDGKTPYGITILVANQKGIKELYTIISSMHRIGDYDVIDLDTLKQNRDNLLIGSCGNTGELYTLAAYGGSLDKIASFYDYFEIYPSKNEKECSIYKTIYESGNKLNVPVVAVGNCHYLDKSDEICRRVIRTVNGHKHDNQNLFFHNTEEMLEEFSYLGKEAAYETVVINTNIIADSITSAIPIKTGLYPPIIKNAFEQIQECAYAKAKKIYGNNLPGPIEERLKKELYNIDKYEFSVYYLITQRIVRHINDSGYYVSPRGCISSVLTAFLLGISDCNPMPAHYYCSHCHYINFDVSTLDSFDLADKDCPVCGCKLSKDGHNVPYETFMGCDGNKLPYIDLNIPRFEKGSIFKLLKDMFGADNLAHAGLTKTLFDRYTKEYITNYESETADCFTEEQKSYICKKLLGIKMDNTVHHDGIIILPKEMEFEEFTPIREINSSDQITKVTHMDFHSISNTLIKLNLPEYIMPDMLKLLENFTGISLQNVVWGDPRVYALFERADTLGIPDFELTVMKEMLLKIKPKSFDDLVRIFGLAHGAGTWIGNGEIMLNFNHKLNELPIFRDDVFMKLMEYGFERESAYKIAEFARKGQLHYHNDLTYYHNDLTLELKEQMLNKKVPLWYIRSLTKILYMMPKAHAVTNVMNAVRAAWYKVHFPTEFYAAYLSCFYRSYDNMSEEDKLHFSKVVDECSTRGIHLLKPDSEKSHYVNYLPECGNIRMPSKN